MFLTNWLSSVRFHPTASRPTTHRRRQKTVNVHAAVECLESRLLMSATSGDAPEDTTESHTDTSTSNELSEKAIELDRALGLKANDTEDWGEVGEKWLGSASGTWYFITQEGNLYKWSDSQPGEDFVDGSELIAEFDSTYHADPSKLTDAFPHSERAATMDQELGLKANETFDWGGEGEKWFGSASGTSYFMTKEGKFYEWTGSQPGDDFVSDSELVAEFDESYYAEPSKLSNAYQDPVAVSTDARQARELDQQLGLKANDTENWAGIGEKWIGSASGNWYFIRQDGSFYKWNGSQPGDNFVSDSELVAELSESYYADPSMLTDAYPHADRAAALDQELGLKADATEDWGGIGEKWFGSASGTWYFMTQDGKFYKWSDSQPGVDFISESELIAEFDKSYHADPSKLSEAYPHAERAATLDQELGLKPHETLDWGGAGEKWFGSASGTWYFMTPDGKFYKWTGSQPGDEFIDGSELIAEFDESYYAESSKLSNTHQSAVVASANTQQARELDQQLGLKANDTENWAGIGEKWLGSTSGTWYFIRQDGSFYKWTGSQPGENFIADSELVAEFDENYYADPSKLTDAFPHAERAVALDQDLGLKANDTEDWGGIGEKWFGSTSGTWYFMTQDGKFYEWSDSQPGEDFIDESELIAEFDKSYHADPFKLHDAFFAELTTDSELA